MINTRGNTKSSIIMDTSAFSSDDDFNEEYVETNRRIIDKKPGNQFEAYLGKGFINDLKTTLTGKIEIVNDTQLTIECLDRNKLTFIITPEEQCIEAFSPKRTSDGTFARQRRTGILNAKFAFMWKAFITLAFAQYNKVL